MFCVHSQPPLTISGLELMHPGHADMNKKPSLWYNQIVTSACGSFRILTSCEF